MKSTARRGYDLFSRGERTGQKGEQGRKENRTERLFLFLEVTAVSVSFLAWATSLMSCRSLWLVHFQWAAQRHWVKLHQRSCQQDQASLTNSGGCVRTSCRGRGSGKHHSSKVIKSLFYCSSSFMLSMQTAQCELALPQDSVFHAKCVSKCFAMIKYTKSIRQRKGKMDLFREGLKERWQYSKAEKNAWSLQMVRMKKK